jgi:hypothetical protein
MAYHADTDDYLTRLASAGGTISAYNTDLLDTKIKYAYAYGLRGSTDYLKYWLCLNLTESFTGCLVPVYDDGVGNATNFNFVSGDWSASLGLTGNGTNKTLSSLWNPTTKLGTFSNGGRCDAHISAWVTALNNTTGLGVRGLAGTYSDYSDGMVISTLNNTDILGYITTDSVDLYGSQTTGLQLMNRVSVSSLRFLNNNTLQDSTASVASPIVSPNFNIPLFSLGASAYSPCSISNFTIGLGLPTTDLETALYNMLNITQSYYRSTGMLLAC